jgi:glycosyltransferase involved in cell wall biosynthesis
VEKLAPKYKDIQFRIVGRGSNETENYLKARFKRFSNVKIYEQAYDNMQNEHYAADIEVIPSYGAEGTSFSLIEAMAAGCATISSNIGGLANVVIQGYNGILVQPTVRDFEKETIKLIENPVLARELGKRAYEVVKLSLNKRRWEEQILKVVDELFF